MIRRNRSDSAASAVKAMVNAALPDIQPPAHVTLSPEAEKFWPGVVRARARDEWKDVDLVIAAQLAECQALIEQESATLRVEGMVAQNERGTMVENPRNRVVHTLAQREMALMRTLLMGGKVSGDARNFKGARTAEHQARQTIKELQDEELLA